MQVVYSLISADFLSEELSGSLSPPDAETRLAYPSRIRFYSRGSNDVYRVRSGDSRFTLRVSTARRRRQSVEHEVSLLWQAESAGLHVCPPIATHNGGLSFELQAPEGVRQAVLFEFIEGDVNLPLKSRQQARSIGEAIGAFHLWADSNESLPMAETVPGLCQIAECSDSLLLPSEDRAFVKATASRVAAAIEDGAGADDAGVCHGDLVGGGNTISTARGAFLFDFEHMGHRPRAYDLATLRQSIEPDVGVEIWASFLDGYRSRRWIADRTLAQLPLFGVARQLWLIGAQHKIGENWGHVWERERLRDNVASLRKLWEELPTDL